MRGEWRKRSLTAVWQNSEFVRHGVYESSFSANYLYTTGVLQHEKVETDELKFGPL